MSTITLKFALNELRFEEGGDGAGLAVFAGEAATASARTSFSMRLSQLETGEWKVRTFDWLQAPLVEFGVRAFYQAVTNEAAKLLYPIHIWPGEQSDSGAQIVMNQKIPPEAERANVCLAFRPDVLTLPPPPWDELWNRIEDRLNGDPCFWVQGVDDKTVSQAISELKQVFPYEWVEARFRQVAGPSAGMDASFPQNEQAWFPAYHLARTAAGAICVNPAWNYLVEMGLARRKLEGIPGLEYLDRQLCRSPGSRHQLCLAAELHERGLLLELEPNKGSGHNDLAVAGTTQVYEVEVKEFTSARPATRLDTAVAQKVTKVPAEPQRAVLIHVVLAEDQRVDEERETQFVEAAEALGPRLSPRISGLVVGRCFLDSAGGAVKRDMISVVCNPNAIHLSDRTDIEQLFRKNYDAAVFPVFGFRSFVDTEPHAS